MLSPQKKDEIEGEVKRCVLSSNSSLLVSTISDATADSWKRATQGLVNS
jgi:hypothetical protein